MAVGMGDCPLTFPVKSVSPAGEPLGKRCGDLASWGDRVALGKAAALPCCVPQGSLSLWVCVEVPWLRISTPQERAGTLLPRLNGNPHLLAAFPQHICGAWAAACLAMSYCSLELGFQGWREDKSQEGDLEIIRSLTL